MWYTRGSISCLRHLDDRSGTRPEAGRPAEKERSTMIEYISRNESETEKIGESLAARLQAGTVLAYRGGLGAGKTAFTRGLAKGLGCEGRVTSPTFTIVNEYEGGRLPLFHFDMYRLDSADELFHIGWEDYLARGGVCAVEWSENVAGAIEPDAVRVSIVRGDGDDDRRITIEGVDL